ncbi:Protein spinster-like protein 1 [Acropora cervicornis]|uniref:Protein spinster-like protein 1 n=1 Tax=Acropora cervicornis TaxID=6130 RepID=A0AAD9R722_ACRCE|nr:Protein spinster-like protein 1 [Acropora cervicornis]
MSTPVVEYSRPEERDGNMEDSAKEAVHEETVSAPQAYIIRTSGNKRAYITVLVLFVINLLNYMDRQTIAGLLDDIQKYFDIEDNNSAAGLLQTVFICSYMVLAPIFGYMGDRYKRKYIMAAGILIWSGTVYLSTLLDKKSFWWFLALRGIVGIGEASYSTIAPTVIADLFTGDMRTRMLSVFYFAIPVGRKYKSRVWYPADDDDDDDVCGIIYCSGLGYIIGTQVAKAFDQWQWGLRTFFYIFYNSKCISVIYTSLPFTFYRKSFIWLNIGFTCVTFVTGALSFWAPKFFLYATRTQGITDVSLSDVSLKVGGITCAAGIVGVWLGAEIARRYKVRNRKADAIVCAVALLGSAPFLYVCLVLAAMDVKVTYYIIIPPRRSTAEAVQILVSHLLGDAGSPWLVGVISDRIRKDDSDHGRAQSLEYSLMMSAFVCVLGGFCFIMCGKYLVKDREVAEEYTRTCEDERSLLGSVASKNFGPSSDDKQAQDNDEDYYNEDDKLLETDPTVTPVSSERDTLVVPVDVHCPLPVQEDNHVI